ncbi:dynamin family protein [Herbiconiux sp. SYSU D00978]|uniref:dynamin family protein n=1 Tax=Herbiconiux sp. SYSU D00978 TaxID=2812562 RepID=UPI001A96FED9|nr:dynamin family protein [Herbiconiux sp. SYSU D00978]
MAELVDLVDRALELVGPEEREDLRRRLEQTRERLSDPSIRVIVVGEFKQGKSRLVNALVNAPVCPVDDDIATSAPTVVKQGATPSAVVVSLKDGMEASDGPAAIERTPIPLDQLPAYVSEHGNPGNERRILAAEVSLPRKILDGGLALVDSPGVGGLDSIHSLTTLSTLPTADAALLVSDASQEYTAPEMQFLRQALRITPNVACVLTKTDLYPQWRRIAELDQAHVARLGQDIPFFPVSSDLRLEAIKLQDGELNAESGFPDLVSYLRKEIVGKAERIQRRGALQDVRSVLEHLSMSLQSELSALVDPASTPQVIAELQSAKERTDEMRQKTSRWQTTLNDGIADLSSDVEHDLRDRLRQIQREAEEAIGQGDPGPVWDQLVDWLQQRVAAAVSDTFVWSQERSKWLSEQVAQHFTEEEAAIPVVRVDDTEDVLDPVPDVPELDRGRLSAMQKVLIGMRGSYGGVLMIGLITGIVGMSLINPLSVAAGVLIGRKAYSEDQETRLKRRQQEAKAIVRRQIDDVIFQVGKQLKDRLRLVQRATRDHFTSIADQNHRSLTDSVLAAQKAANMYTAERERRIKEIKARLARIDQLRAKIPAEPKERVEVAAAAARA